MMVTSINASTKGVSQSEVKRSGSVLGKDDFLQLLVLQLRMQSPLDPMNTQDFSTQLAQFSTLEAVQNVENNLKNLFFLQAGSLLGKTVEFVDGTKGTVEGVIFSGDVPLIEVGEIEYQLSDVVRVE
ncbi:MAG: flagellar hook capping FlgD N-terminal domain-containing protein [Candidatus Caldatribacteriaceae bacterium]